MPSGTFRVLWAEAAVRDLQDIVTYVAADSPAHANRLLATIRTRAGSLEGAPRRGRIVPELAESGLRTWRELIVSPYRIIYRIADNVVYVLAVLDGRRDLREVLLERLLRQSSL